MQEDPLSALRPNAPVVDVPWPLWLWWTIAGATLVIAGILVWLGWWLASRRCLKAANTPRQVALSTLEQLRREAAGCDPYAFSIAVSEALRRYIQDAHGVHATQQTSQEFLASIAQAPMFSDEDRTLLGKFLERCDLLKFARFGGSADDIEALLDSAFAFVQCERSAETEDAR